MRAVLFDVGGPIDTEVIHERLVDEAILEELAAAGFAVTHAELAAASETAVRQFAPNAYAAVCFELAGRDAEAASRVFARVAAGSDDRARRRGGIELRLGIGDLLERLHARGLLLGLAANQPARIVAELDRHGLGRFFAHREVSGHHGFRKPDVRLFLRACEDLGVEPTECVMVGDRIDNDVVPARLLGMGTVLLRTGRHIRQQPRSADEVPDAEVHDIRGMERAILDLLSLAAS